MSDFQSLWIQEFSLFEGRFLPFVRVLWGRLELGHVVTTAGLGFPQALGVLPCAEWPWWHHWHPALGLGSAPLSGNSCSGGSPCLGRWGTPCHADGWAGPIWWCLGLPPLCLCHEAEPPVLCPSRAWRVWVQPWVTL